MATQRSPEINSQNIYKISHSDIAAICATLQPFSGTPFGARLVRVAPYIAIKFGTGVSKQEFGNQEYAYQYVDPVILRVPKPLLYFRAEHSGLDMGFFAMEYLEGHSLQDEALEDNLPIIPKVIPAIEHLSTIPIPKSQGPGPVGSGIPQGYIWSDDGAGEKFTSLQGAEQWMNKRLDIVKQPHVSFEGYVCTMRHMDLERRNIIVMPDRSIGFVDWEFAGFYPKIFEVWTLRYLFTHADKLWFNPLLDSLGPQTEQDEHNLGYMGIPAMVNLKYS
jgi:hypothetical protein